MQSIIRIFIVLLIPFFAYAQVFNADKYYVQFSDKNDSPFSIENPEEFLSLRAIERRQNQGIDIDMYDLPVNPQYLLAVAEIGVEILNPTKWMNGVTVHTEDIALIDSIALLPFVEDISIVSYVEIDTSGFVKPNLDFETFVSVPPKELQSDRRDTEFDYGFGLNQIAMLKGDEFHEMGYRGKGMVIAVLDAGFVNTDTLSIFDSLWLNNQILGTWDFVNGTEVSFNGHYHGTMVLSCMGGNAPGLLIGTAPEASYWLLQSEFAPTEYIIEEYNWVSAAEFADSVGADIINSSLAYHDYDVPMKNINPTYEDLNGDTQLVTIGADIAAAKGILVVNSMGNSGNDTTWHWLAAPSDGDSIMGVGAVDSFETIANFSSYGPSADGRVKPNLVAMGRKATVASPYSPGVNQANGTSFSSPIMAGISAILWQANPEKNNMDILRALEQSSDRYDNPDDRYGHGIPDVMLAQEILNPVNIDVISKGDIKVYPNPSVDFVQIEFNELSEYSNLMIRITDLMGKNVLSSKINGFSSTSVSVSSLEPGIYLLSMHTEDKIISTEKLVIQ